MGNRGINSSKPCVSHQRNLAYLKSRAAQKFCSAIALYVSHYIVPALRRSKIAEQKST